MRRSIKLFFREFIIFLRFSHILDTFAWYLISIEVVPEFFIYDMSEWFW